MVMILLNLPILCLLVRTVLWRRFMAEGVKCVTEKSRSDEFNGSNHIQFGLVALFGAVVTYKSVKLSSNSTNISDQLLDVPVRCECRYQQFLRNNHR